MATVDELQGLLDELSKVQASSPLWFQLIDHIVIILLHQEIERMKQDK